MALRTLTEFGNPILRKKAKRVSASFLRTRAFKKLKRDMLATMRKAGGIGIAAPQVGVSRQITVLELRPTPSRPRLKQKGPLFVINPEIVRHAGRKNLSWEGCLSFPDGRGKVPRASSVLVRYTDTEGKRRMERVSGLWAQIFQHEINHLNGILYVDRVKDMKSLMTVKEYQRRIVDKK